MATLEQAIRIAAAAHLGQRDRYGKPYVLHPLRMMMRLEREEEMTVAVLHDIVEETDWTLDGLRREGFSEEIVAAVDALTRREGESYEESVERSGRNLLARRVKLADLEDNMDLRRIREVRPEDLERMRRYHRAWRRLARGDGA